MGIHKDKYSSSGTAAMVLSSAMTPPHHQQEQVKKVTASKATHSRKWEQYSLKTHYRYYSQHLVPQNPSSSSLSSLGSSSTTSTTSHSSPSQQHQKTGLNIPLIISSTRASLNLLNDVSPPPAAPTKSTSYANDDDASSIEPTLGDEEASFLYNEEIGEFPLDAIPTKQMAFVLPEWLSVDNITMATLRKPLEEFPLDSIPTTTTTTTVDADSDGWTSTWFD